MFQAPTTETKPQGHGAALTLPQPMERELYPFAGTLDAPRRGRPDGLFSSLNAVQRHPDLAGLHRAYGNQAVLRMLNRSQRSSSGGRLQRKCACGGEGSADCAGCQEEKEHKLQRVAARPGSADTAPPIVHDVLHSPGQELSVGTRAFFEPRFGQNFSQVRVHTDSKAAESTRAVNALAYTVGQDVVFDAGQCAPETTNGKGLLAHELTHVVQQSIASRTSTQPSCGNPGALGQDSDRVSERAAAFGDGGRQSGGLHRSEEVLQRTPARKVSCGVGPLNLPDGTVIDDPVGVITAAENRANELLDAAIDELDFTRQQILGGSPIGFPTISDALGLGLRLMGLDPDSPRVWREAGGVGNYTAALLLRRLRLIRGTIGDGSFFFTCLGPAAGRIGICDGPICDGHANSRSCEGSFRINFCQGFWTEDAEFQAGTLLHESAHNSAHFIGFVGNRAVEVGSGENIAEC